MTSSRREVLLNRRWPYSEADPSALEELGQRIAAVGRRRSLIHYSELVRGIVMRMANVRDGHPFELGVPDWPDLDRAILGDLLGSLSVASYQRGGILASALVTAKTSDEPSEGFWSLVSELGLFDSQDQTRRLVFWSQQVELAHEWYAEHDR